MFFTFRIGAGLGLCKARNDAAAEDAKSKGGGSLARPVAPPDVVPLLDVLQTLLQVQLLGRGCVKIDMPSFFFKKPRLSQARALSCHKIFVTL